MLDWYIHKNGRPIRVFQVCIRVWIIGEEKTILGRARRDFVSLIGVRAEKTSVKRNLHLQINIIYCCSYISLKETYGFSLTLPL